LEKHVDSVAAEAIAEEAVSRSKAIESTDIMLTV
jgi:hypothetical protein